MLSKTSVKIASIFCADLLLAVVGASLTAQAATAASDKHQRAAPIARPTHHHLYATYGQPRLAQPGSLPYRGITQEQRAWNAWVQAHGYHVGDYIPYNSQFHRGGIHCDETGNNILPSCDVPDTTIYGGG
jgi:hypothetical protein